MKDLIAIEPKDITQVFTVEGIDPIIEKIKEEVAKFEPDLSTDKGRKEIASMARKVASSKTYLDGLGKDLVSDWKARSKIVDDCRKKVRDTLDKLRDEVRLPLTEFENKEKERIAKHEDTVRMLEQSAITVDDNGSPLSIDALERAINLIHSFDTSTEKMQEFCIRATNAKDKAINTLTARIEELKEHERQQEENRRLREEQEKRDREERERKMKEEAAEEAKREAERKAKEEADAKEREHQKRLEEERLEKERTAREKKEAEDRAARLEQEKKDAAEKAKRDQEEADRKAKEREARLKKEAEEREAKAREDERKRIEEENRKKAEEQKRREADLENRKNVNNAALSAIMMAGKITEEAAKDIVTAIAKGEIPRVSISY